MYLRIAGRNVMGKFKERHSATMTQTTNIQADNYFDHIGRTENLHRKPTASSLIFSRPHKNFKIQGTLKKIAPDKFDKMIITDGQSVKRGNYVYAKLKFEKVERQVEQIKFPLHGAIKDNFAELEGGEGKLGAKAPINSNKIFETLKSNYQIIGKGANSNQTKDAFNYPLDEANGELAKQQKKYFFPDLTFQETCEECKGHGYTKCGGGAGGFIGRNVLSGQNLHLGGCGGTRQIKDGDRYRSCKTCHGKGEIACKDCGTKGEVKCDKCSGRGEVQCRDCSGKGDITCSVCYGDKDRYGKVDCPECATIGTVAQIVYVDSFVSQNENEKVILKGDKLNISDTNVTKHVKSNQTGQVVFKKVNEKVEETYDEFSKEYAEIFEKDLGLNKNNYPLVTKEEIYYQVVPCVELSYKHMLTNTVHEFTIVNIWDNPEIIFHSEPEQLKQDLGNASKAVGGFFGKLFKTKGFKTKEDKKNEITLLIHLAKIDGKIEDEEKISLSEAIGHLEEFTNSEKQQLFDLMNSATLPPLSKNDTAFSSKERANEVLEKLTKLAMADGELEGLEKEFIDKIKSLIG